MSPELSDDLAALRRALGRQLATQWQAAEIGQQQLARKAGYSRSSVAHAEAGRQLLTHGFWQVADDLLKSDGALLAGFERLHALKQECERRAREAELAEALRAMTASRLADEADRLAVPIGREVVAGLVTSAAVELVEELAGPLVYLAFLGKSVPAEWADQIYDQLTNFLREWADTMKRRGLLQLLGWAATTASASPAVGGLDGEEQERLARAIVVPSRVDGKVVDHIVTIFHHCKRQDDTLGPRAVLHTVLAQRQLVHSLLAGCPSVLRCHLLSVYSDMSSSVANYFFDLNDVDSALRYCEQARAAAQDARNTGLGVWALCNMSYFSSMQGKAHAGLDFAAAAQSLAATTDDSLLGICVAETAGTAYAVDGQHQACLAQFDKAHAVDAATAGLTLFDPSFVGMRANCTLRLGRAHLQAGDVEEAARVLGNGALLAAQASSARLIREVHTTRARMQPWRATPAVRTLDEQLVGCGLGPGHAD